VSTIKSSAEDLTLNADGSNEIKFQINAVEKASINSSGLLTSTTIDATALTGNLPAIDGSNLTGISAGTALTGSTNNTIPTVTGANAISGEANLTFDGTDLTLGTGDIVFGTAGKGICLGVTSNTDANTLDDYEEGLWTPTIKNDAETYSATTHVSFDEMAYTKIGRIVIISGIVGTSSLGSVSGRICLTGLPFAATGGFSGYGAIAVSDAAGLAITAGQNVGLRPSSGTSRLDILVWDGTIGTSYMDASEWTDDGRIAIGGVYLA
jgi:hypothetical protein